MNRVTLNIAGDVGGPAPNDDAPPITINGVAVDEVLAISLQAGGGQATYVTITFKAEIASGILTKAAV